MQKLDPPICAPTDMQSSTLSDDELRKFPFNSISLQPTKQHANNKQSQFSLELNKPTRFLCKMISDPANQLEFSWFLNNSFLQKPRLIAQITINQNLPVYKINKMPTTSSKLHPNDLKHLNVTYSILSPNLVSSELIWVAQNHLDFGQLYCKARNEFGQQSDVEQSQCQVSIAPKIASNKEQENEHEHEHEQTVTIRQQSGE